jgi:hypothetical protein
MSNNAMVMLTGRHPRMRSRTRSSKLESWQGHSTASGKILIACEAESRQITIVQVSLTLLHLINLTSFSVTY